MKTSRVRVRLLAAVIATALPMLVAGTPQSITLLDASVQSRVAFDSNPMATGGTAGALMGTGDAVVATLGANLAVGYKPGPEGFDSRFTFGAEGSDFRGKSTENFNVYRFGLTAQGALAGWRLTGDSSILAIDGSRDTPASATAVNGNGITVWRERRDQSQYRAKLTAQRLMGPWLWRGQATWLAYDYRTHLVAGHMTLADRSDALAGVDLGRKGDNGVLWYVGARAGQQKQDPLSLPNCQFDYSNRHTRLVAGFERQVGKTMLAFAAGPDFAHYDGAVDARVFSHRDHEWLWFEGSFSRPLGEHVTWSGRAMRWAWLSSTGKSACTDLAAETALAWTITKRLAIRASGKVHQIAYFPSVRNDWEGLTGIGVTWAWSARAQFTVDWLTHEGWNAFRDLPEREFSRSMLSMGCTLKR